MQHRRLLSTSLLTTAVEQLSRDCIRVVDTKLIGKKAIAAKTLTKGTIINRYNAPIFTYPTMHTVCLTKDVHVAPTYGAECISHACGIKVPNVMMQVVNGSQVNVVVTRDVAKDQDLYFNYNTTEWTMSCPFECQCPDCAQMHRSQKVQGFSHLSAADQEELFPFASPFIQSLFKQSRAALQPPQQQQNEVLFPK